MSGPHWGINPPSCALPPWPARPVIYEINTWPWLQNLTKAGLQDVTAREWQDTVPAGTDVVWLMGVWERSELGREVARREPGLRDDYLRVLPDLTDADIVGSPYCVADYHVDHRLGGDDGLALARATLAGLGLRLFVDWVPNHVALDHPWTRRPDDFCVAVNDAEAARTPDAYRQLGGRWVALGRDPFFPPWTDVAQLNAFSPALRDAAVETLSAIADQSDGVRCDMAMLILDDVFARTWSHLVGEPLPIPYWREVITRVRERHPDFRFVGEAYWGREGDLVAQGMDACYDKGFYDALAAVDAARLRAAIEGDPADLERKVRFLENHDERRAAATWSQTAWHALSVAVATVPGYLLIHSGQLEGRRLRLPVQLGRLPDEPLVAELRAWWTKLLDTRRDLRGGAWSVCATTGWADNASHENLAAWSWRKAEVGHIVVVNLSPTPSQGRVHLGWAGLEGTSIELVEALDTPAGPTYSRGGSELTSEGLFVDLPAWGFHLLRTQDLRPAGP